jgi:hypothetical protein
MVSMGAPLGETEHELQTIAIRTTERRHIEGLFTVSSANKFQDKDTIKDRLKRATKFVQTRCVE